MAHVLGKIAPKNDFEATAVYRKKTNFCPEEAANVGRNVSQNVGQTLRRAGMNLPFPSSNTPAKMLKPPFSMFGLQNQNIFSRD